VSTKGPFYVSAIVIQDYLRVEYAINIAQSGVIVYTPFPAGLLPFCNTSFVLTLFKIMGYAKMVLF